MSQKTTAVPIQPEYLKDEEDSETGIRLHLETFQPDSICAKCGLWRSEHLWDLCQHPHWT